MPNSTDTRGRRRGLLLFRTLIVVFGILLGGPLFLLSLGIAFEGAANLAMLEFAWGLAGVTGYLSGCIALIIKKPVTTRQRRRISAGIGVGIIALLPLLLNTFAVLFAIGPMLCAIALLVYLWQHAEATQPS